MSHVVALDFFKLFHRVAYIRILHIAVACVVAVVVTVRGHLIKLQMTTAVFFLMTTSKVEQMPHLIEGGSILTLLRSFLVQKCLNANIVL